MKTKGLARIQIRRLTDHDAGNLRWRFDRLFATIVSACVLMAVVCGSSQFACAAWTNSVTTRYQTAASILSLTPEQAQQGDSILLQGVVTVSTDLGLIIQDQTAGIWIYWDHPEDFVPGDQVEVRGNVNPGRFSLP